MVLLVFLPEVVGAILMKVLVVIVVFGGAFEGWMTRVKSEENDSEGEDVGNLTLVGLSLSDFWCHVGLGATVVCGQSSTILTSGVASKSKVGDLKVKISVDQYVFRLKISVAESFRVDVINCGEKLLEVVFADGCRQSL